MEEATITINGVEWKVPLSEADYIAHLEAENAQLQELVEMFIAWANITVIRAHMEHDDPRDDSWHSDDWQGRLASGHYDILQKLPKHIQEAIKNYKRPKKTRLNIVSPDTLAQP